jgi:hypothetical protein
MVAMEHYRIPGEGGQRKKRGARRLRMQQNDALKLSGTLPQSSRQNGEFCLRLQRPSCDDATVQRRMLQSSKRTRLPTLSSVDASWLRRVL